jgi:hypothetical protein
MRRLVLMLVVAVFMVVAMAASAPAAFANHNTDPGNSGTCTNGNGCTWKKEYGQWGYATGRN